MTAEPDGDEPTRPDHCGPRRIDGPTRVPALPTIKLLRLEDTTTGRTTHLAISNDDDEIGCFYGSGLAMPCMESSVGQGQTGKNVRWVGAGAGLISSSWDRIVRRVRLGEDVRPFRVHVTIQRHAPDGSSERIRSSAIRIPPSHATDVGETPDRD